MSNLPPLTRQQREALKRVYDRQPMPVTYREFRRQAVRASYDNCVMIAWNNIWLGIEPDGYTHS